MDTLLSDLRFALRQLRRTPLFSCAAVATLAIGIGATTAIFSTVNATLLRPLPYPRYGELVDVHTRLNDGRVTTGLLSSVEIATLNDSPSVVARAAGVGGQPFDATLVRDDGTPVNVVLNGVTEGFFDVLGLPMARGRAFTHDEHLAGGRDAPIAVVVSYHTWNTLFGSDPGIVGKTIRIAEAPVTTTIVGVASSALDFPHDTDFWLNFRTNPQDVAHNFATILRLRPGVTLDRLRGASAVAMAGLARTVPSDVGREYVVRSLVSSLIGDLGPMLVIVLGATALLLVLACVNVTNLLLARGMARTREVAVRSALGASRSRRRLVSSTVFAMRASDPIVLLAACAIVGGVTLAATTIPAIRASRLDPVRALRSE